MIRWFRHSLIFAAGLLGSVAAQAVIIEYTTSNLGGNRYEYTYNVINDDLAAGIEEFTIFFALGDYENLAIGSTPAGWDPIVLQPDPFLPDDGLYDALALGAPIGLGESLGGFSVSFDWLGAGDPGAQPFEVVDFFFNVLASGDTVAAAVPEPPLVGLLALGVCAICLRKRAVNPA